jgi:hypothetical protein
MKARMRQIYRVSGASGVVSVDHTQRMFHWVARYRTLVQLRNVNDA